MIYFNFLLFLYRCFTMIYIKLTNYTMKFIRLLLCISLLCITGFAQAQDVIVKKDNSTILSKVVEINSSEIRYKKWSNQDGPTYSISISDVASINYANGEVDKFANTTTNQVQTQPVQTQPVQTQQVQVSAPVPVSAPLSHYNYMERDGNSLTLNGRELSDNEVRELVGYENYSTYLSAKRQINSGRVFTTIFWVSLGSTVLFSAASGIDSDFIYAAYFTAILADVSLPLMCILKGAGKGRMNWVADEYNRKARYGNAYSYELSPSLMKCSTPQLQTTYGVGMTFSLNF